MQTIKFKLTDAWGDEHAYEVAEFSVDDTSDLHADVAGVIAGPLAEVIGAVVTVKLAGITAAKDAAESAGDADGPVFIALPAILDALKTLDWSQLSGALQMLPRLIKEAAPDGKPSLLYARILAQTKRTRFEPTGNGGQAAILSPVSSSADRDRAYGGGNIIEQYKAVLAVLAVHFGPFGRSGSNVWSELSKTLLGALPLRRTQSSETPAPSGVGSKGSAAPPS